ncbi:alpha-2-macroglobulin family protein [Rhodoblastus acidophilus]|uniref:Alpha-2-macroglobulin family protein n=1 Tax=Candidatus Rhodoblastus alkanivorans TaxID=2954117 RepID=A0ABS9ZAD2_9HYPH|nr:alpha-2-macroglobulin [Candidatus Rhodoblastus alkanivorans]MCI4677846.1 alpha-2-macroglobulin family protein [Candidatus Rhodoblastus alkanivorans]MCI4684655.1 alpha-2-macroglobulin family protein [Candidatus Rhodoblastus alkanivorans]MDI4641977.1 alpha-2-macroglobulin family protein [Rhodoblastus acidophilus]
MSLFSRLRAAFLVIFFASSCAFAAQKPQVPVLQAPALQAQGLQNRVVKPYANGDLSSSATRLEQTLADDSAELRAHVSLFDLRRQAVALGQKGGVAKTLPVLGAIVAAAPDSVADWLLFARASLAASGPKSDQSDALKDQAQAAAFAAYRHARVKTEEAAALALIGEIFASRESWRDALNAYRASLDAFALPPVQKTYADLREKYGFRALDYKIDNESASPRVCFQFSEDLARGRGDFSPYVTLDGRSDAAVSSEERQICVEGLKHGEHYHIALRRGLPSAVGESLPRNLDYVVFVRDRSPQAHFTGRNYVLPRIGPEGVPIVSVNTARVKVRIFRIGDRNLLPTVSSEDFLAQLSAMRLKQFGDRDGEKIWSGTLDVKSELNQDVVTDFPVLEVLGRPQPGVYVMSAAASDDLSASNDDEDDYSLRATQWFVVSDLALTALSGRDGVTVLARSLATAEPKAGVDVRLIAKNNELLAKAVTDAKGEARFAPGFSRGQGGLAPGLVIVSDGKADYDFLNLQQNAFDLTDRGVKGRDPPGALDAFVYAERGVYRSGETVHLAALLRDAGGIAAAAPLTMVVKRPDGVEFKRASLPDQGLGGRAFDVVLPADAASGGWTVQAFSDPKSPAIGETGFLVEDYVPERLDMVLTPKSAAARPGETTRIGVAVRYLYGAPGANLIVNGDVEIDAAGDHGLPALKDYEAGVADEDFSPVKNELDDAPTTDAKGEAVLKVDIPAVKATRPLEAKIAVRAGEAGGHAIERLAYLPLLPSGGLIGVKKDFANLSEGSRARFDVIAVGPDGLRTTRRNVRWSLYRISNDYQWYKQDGRWNFEQIKSSRRVADGAVDLTPDAPAKIAAVVGLGQYRLDLRDDDPKDLQTSVTFDVGWSGEAKAETPDRLDVTLDKPAYAAGETMKLKIFARSDSTATIAVLGDGVKATLDADLKKGDNEIALPVGKDWGVGAYALVLAHRPLDKAAGRMPGRAIGLAWFAVDPAAHRLDIALNAPERSRPRGKLELPIELAGLAAGEEAYVTVAAVDVGILNLTRYQTPDPREHFFGQRALSTEIRDIYGYLIDGLQGSRGRIRSGGDSGGEETSAEKPNQEPLALYSGVVRVGPDGKAKVSFDLPAFNGTVRVMAVAWSKNRTGSASADVIVRDAVVVQASLPRFLALDDQSRLNLRFDNVEGAAGDYQLSVDLHGPLASDDAALRQTIKLGVGAKASVDIPLRATGVGAASLDVRLTGPQFEATQSLALNVEPGTSALVERSFHDLQPGESLVLSRDLLAEFIPTTGAVTASASPLGAVDVAGLLTALDVYPWFCSEQTVSRAMPLLYLSKLPGAERQAIEGDIPSRVNRAIAILLSRQDSSGGFGLWSAEGGEDLWLTAFVSDFLTRARENKYAVPQRAMDQALDRLRNFVVNASDVKAENSAALAYALYVLARNGRPVAGDLRYFVDARLDAFATPFARAQLAAASALIGDRARAAKTFNAASAALQTAKTSALSRADYGSLLRDGAGLLTLASESQADQAVILKTAQVVDRAAAATPHASTQEESWMVLAAQAFGAQAEAQNFVIDGAEHKGVFAMRYDDSVLTAKKVTIVNRGQAPVRLAISVSGRPVAKAPAESHGYRIERGFYRLDGTPVAPNEIKQNDRLVVALKITETEAAFARLILEDRLPAGLEIDNPNLYDGGSAEGLEWVKATVTPTHTEYKDDRFVAAFERSGSDKATFAVAYIVRAVTPGTYVSPPATIEDMYRPERFGRTGFGGVEISAGGKK